MTTEGPGEMLTKFGRPMRRREFLKLASLLGFSAGAAALPTACQQAPAPPPSATTAPAPAAKPAATSVAAPAAGTPKRGGTLKVPVNADVTPWPPIGLVQNIIFNKSIMNMLLRYSAEDWSPQPDLAEKWEVAKDGLTWTFYLRKGVTWHDGKPFTAEDVKFSVQTYADPKVNAIQRGNFQPISRVDVVDANTVKIVTSKPYSALPELLCFQAFMMPKHLLEGQEFNPTKLPQDYIKKPIGTGPFKFVDNVSGDHLTVAANENYFEGRPYLDSVIYKVVRDLNSAAAQVKTGELDIAFVVPALLPTLQGAPNLNVVETQEAFFTYFGMNYRHPQLGKWFGEKTVRQALAHAMNVDGMMQQVAAGKAVRMNGPISPAMKKWYVKDARTFAYDPGKAKAILSDFGFKPGPDGILAKDGQKFAFTILTDAGAPERQQTSLIIQQNLKDIGIDVKVQSLEYNDFIRSMRVTKEYDAVLFFWNVPATPALHNYYSTSGTLNEWGYSNPEVDKLFAQGLEEFDEGKRQAIYSKVYTMIAEDQPSIFLYSVSELHAVNKRVKGWAAAGYRTAFHWLQKVSIDS